MIAVSFDVMRWPLVRSWMGAGHWKDQATIRNLEFSAPPCILQREERENGVNDRSLRDEVSINIPEVWGSESFQVGGHVGRTTCTERAGSSSPPPPPTPHTLPMHLFRLAVPNYILL